MSHRHLIPIATAVALILVVSVFGLVGRSAITPRSAELECQIAGAVLEELTGHLNDQPPGEPSQLLALTHMLRDVTLEPPNWSDWSETRFTTQRHRSNSLIETPFERLPATSLSGCQFDRLPGWEPIDDRGWVFTHENQRPLSHQQYVLFEPTNIYVSETREMAIMGLGLEGETFLEGASFSSTPYPRQILLMLEKDDAGKWRATGTHDVWNW